MLNQSSKRASQKVFRRVRLQVEELEARETPSSAAAGNPIDSAPYAANQIIVGWQNSAPENMPLATSDQALGNKTYVVTLAKGVTVSQAVAYYSKLAGVEFAQPNFIITQAGVPTDTYVGDQWALSAINAQTAWNYTTGGARILVAELDTGVDNTDTDLAPNVVPGFNFITDSTATMDANGHGTVVAGIMGAVGNIGTGIAGVDWNMEIMPLEFMNASGAGEESNAVAAVNYAVAHGAKIINNSWGGGAYDAAMAAAIQNAQAHGVIIVAAAGNNSADNNTTPFYPASYAYNNVVSVAATDQNNNLASFSDYGTTVSIAAPGVSILSTTPGNTYEYYTGTSMATPYVTGALALVWSIHPTWTDTQVIADVLDNTDHLASLNGKVATGLLDLGKAVAAAEPTPTPAPTTPTTPPASSTSSSGVDRFSSGAMNLAYSGKQTVTSTFTVNQHVTIGSLTATVDLQNLYDADVEVTLVSPSGQSVLMFNRRGGTGSNLTNTTFDDASKNAIWLAQAPFLESVCPEYNLSAFANQDAYGTWKLVVTSIASNNSGQILNWSIAVTPAATAAASTTTAAASTPSTGVATFSSGTVNAGYSGKQTVTSTLTVGQHVTIGSLTATVNLQNLYDADLEITLVSPSGESVLLFNHRGGIGSNLTDTTFDDASKNAIWLAQAPFSESVCPEYALSAFANEDAYGTWKLVVTSIASNNSGQILNWSIAVTPAAGTTTTASVGAGTPFLIAPSSSVAATAALANFIYIPATPGSTGFTSGSGTNPGNTPRSNNSANGPAAPAVDNGSTPPKWAGDDQDDSLDRLLASLFVQI